MVRLGMLSVGILGRRFKPRICARTPASSRQSRVVRPATRKRLHNSSPSPAASEHLRDHRLSRPDGQAGHGLMKMVALPFAVARFERASRSAIAIPLRIARALPRDCPPKPRHRRAVIAHRQIALPQAVAWFERGQAARQWRGLPRSADAPPELACDSSTSPSCYCSPQIALPLAMPARAPPALANGKSCLVASRAAPRLPAARSHMAEPFVAHRQVALPLAIARFERGQPLPNGKAQPRSARVPPRDCLRHLDIAELVIAHRRSRCHSLLPGSSAASRSRIARPASWRSRAARD